MLSRSEGQKYKCNAQGLPLVMMASYFAADHDVF